MSDLLARIQKANPLPEPAARHDDDVGLPFEAVWSAVRHVQAPQRRARDRVARSAVGPRRLALGGGVAAAAAVAALLLSAGTTTTVAEAFPILEKHTTDLAGTDIADVVSRWLPPGSIAAAIANAHEFAVGDGTGYVIESPDASTLCLAFTATSGATAGRSWVLGCGPTANALQNGMISTFGFVHGNQDFVALVPTGSSVQLADDGATTQVPITDGIATGVVHDAATLTVDVGGTATANPIGPQPGPQTG